MPSPTIGRLVIALAAALVVGACSASSGTTGTSSAPATQPLRASPTVPASGDGSSPGDASSAPGDGVDLCTVFTADQLGAVVGSPVHLGDSSDMYGMGCRWDTADGKGGVVIQRLPVHAGYGDIAGLDGQHPLSGVGDGATIGPGAFFGAGGDGPFTGKLAAALVGDGFASVLVAPPPSDDAVTGLLQALVDATR